MDEHISLAAAKDAARMRCLDERLQLVRGLDAVLAYLRLLQHPLLEALVLPGAGQHRLETCRLRLHEAPRKLGGVGLRVPAQVPRGDSLRREVRAREGEQRGELVHVRGRLHPVHVPRERRPHSPVAPHEPQQPHGPYDLQHADRLGVARVKAGTELRNREDDAADAKEQQREVKEVPAVLKIRALLGREPQRKLHAEGQHEEALDDEPKYLLRLAQVLAVLLEHDQEGVGNDRQKDRRLERQRGHDALGAGAVLSGARVVVLLAELGREALVVREVVAGGAQGARDAGEERVRPRGGQLAVLHHLPVLRADQGQKGLVDGPQHVHLRPVLPQQLQQPAKVLRGRAGGQQRGDPRAKVRGRSLERLPRGVELVDDVLVGGVQRAAAAAEDRLLDLCAKRLPSTAQAARRLAAAGVRVEEVRVAGLQRVVGLDVVLDVLEHAGEDLADLLSLVGGLEVVDQLLVHLQHKPPLGRGRLRDLQRLHKRGAADGVDHQRQQRDAAHIEEHAVGVLFGDAALDARARDLDAQRQAHGAPEAAPAHDQGVGKGHGLPVGHQQPQDRPRAHDQGRPQDYEHQVDHQQMQVVNRLYLDHDVPRERPGQEEDHRVPADLEHVPDCVHGLVADDLRPDFVREQQRGRDGA
mmetsp:Transcript_64162/g.182165  ORF Transcript_64162/g.182165 Transcript_64162/m.182165 type:complete len:640 (-) Transcript_64162:891-2810(-)